MSGVTDWSVSEIPRRMRADAKTYEGSGHTAAGNALLAYAEILEAALSAQPRANDDSVSERIELIANNLGEALEGCSGFAASVAAITPYIDELFEIAALAQQPAAVDEAWTDAQCLAFAACAFRHAPKNLPEGVTLADIRIGAQRALAQPQGEG